MNSPRAADLARGVLSGTRASPSRAERRVRDTLSRAGIGVGSGARVDIRVRDTSFYTRIAANPAYELGATYVDGLWECAEIDAFVAQLLVSGVAAPFERGWRFWIRSIIARVKNMQSRARAFLVADRHYDIGNDLFEAMLDPSMAYTCALWKPGEATLHGAQVAKMAAVCGKLELRPGERFLDIGCGWGGLMDYASRVCGASATGITVSRNQLEHAARRLKGLPAAQVVLADYRDFCTAGREFDKIAAIEMIEAVGPKNLSVFFGRVHDVLRPGGLCLLQTFIAHRPVSVCNEWFDRHIFPNGVSPSLSLLARAAEPIFGSPSGVENIGLHYDPTLMAWDANLQARWASVSSNYDERFRRMWHFYLRALAGVFRAEHLRVYQIVYQKRQERALR